MSTQLSVLSAPRTGVRRSTWLRVAGQAMAANVLLVVCAHIALPLYFTPVPLTLGTFAVLLLGLLLSPRIAAASMAAYVAEGALGLPVFAPLPALAGIAHLLGPTGGYLVAYCPAAALVSFLWRRTDRGVVAAELAAAAGGLLIVLCGALWLGVMTHGGPGALFGLAVAPFLPGDALKITAAAIIASGWRRISSRTA